MARHSTITAADVAEIRKRLKDREDRLRMERTDKALAWVTAGLTYMAAAVIVARLAIG